MASARHLVFDKLSVPKSQKYTLDRTQTRLYLPLLKMPTTFEYTINLPTNFDKTPNLQEPPQTFLIVSVDVRAPQARRLDPRRRRIGNHRAQQITAPEPGSSGGPVEQEPGLREVSVSYDL